MYRRQQQPQHTHHACYLNHAYCITQAYFFKAIASGKAMPKAKARTQVVNALVYGSRKPHTTVTSTWADGSAGPLMLSFKSGDVSTKAVRRINTNPENEGVVHIYVTKTDSHFMCSEATHYYFNNVLCPDAGLHLVEKTTCTKPCI